MFRFLLPRDLVILMTEWICRWKPFWIPTSDTFQKAYLEEWQRVDDVQKCDPVEDNVMTHPGTTESAKPLKSGCKDVIFKQEQPRDTRHHQSLRGKQLETLTRQLGSSRQLTVPRPFGNYREHHCFPKNACAIIFTQSSVVPFPIV